MKLFFVFIIVILTGWLSSSAQSARKVENFDSSWKFMLGDDSLAKNNTFNDKKWRALDLPHDWSIEGNFSPKNPSTANEGGLPTGIGWYRKTFKLPVSSKSKNIIINFDGVYRNSEVWINGHYLGKRPNGYISFNYDLTGYLKFGNQSNVIAVRVDNSEQPNSRWYSGSGIYRNVWLTTINKTHFKQWGTFITTPQITNSSAIVNISTSISSIDKSLSLKAIIYDEMGKVVADNISSINNPDDATDRDVVIQNPILWSTNHPYLYKVVLQLFKGNELLDDYQVNIGIRSFRFDSEKGFSLNGVHMKIKGVCMHHDLGALGAAVNIRAIERQLQILKQMGCNAIRTSHNPPAPELLNLCDKMGFLVMDESFDMWAKKKNKHDYHEDWAQWHKQDLTDQILRDRNHPCVFIWSIGNEIREQFDSTGISITRELVKIVKNLDDTRPVTSALSESDPHKNFIYQSGALDLVGLNYHQEVYADFLKNYPNQKFIATETMSALETRGFYDTPTDTTRHWPQSSKIPFTQGNTEFAVTAYDNVAAYWGSTHEETWKIIKKHDFLSGLFIWTGFDYLGEPTPYPWPARSSYFGIVDLAGFPKDVYYMYQSEWTDKPVLHLLPHWNWKPGQLVDVWAYYSQAGEVELFFNGKSLGIRKKQGDDLHVTWKVKFEPGTLKAVSRKNGKIVLSQEVHTAGAPAKIQLIADRKAIHADGNDLSFITVKVLDKDGNIVPDADNLVTFKVKGPASIAGVDNGSQISMEPFKANYRKAFHGMCLLIVRTRKTKGEILVEANSNGLKSSSLSLSAN
ncbi:beta-galactosidase GalB [Mucilaginibacter sp. L196]|uniref:beta-galactosidase GalB n=1 Tax=Mucilaginibacter sp. L196 TaxID=1641870 RepID=UPI00131E97C8|nr:beta-galactosidase GalB [Mucilaginibacter sp. L196]